MPVLTDIPYDCINVIFQFMKEYRCMARTAQTCWWLWEQAQDEDLWQNFCKAYLPKERYRQYLLASDKKHPCNASFVSWQVALKSYCNEQKSKAIIGFITKTVRDVDEFSRFYSLDFFAQGVCIGSEGGTSLSAVLTRCSKLQLLSLNRQLVRDPAASAICTALGGHCSSLQVLCLAENKLTDNCGSGIASVAGNLPQLTRLDLSGNSLTHVTAALLGPAMAQSTSLKEVLLNTNPLGNAGVKAILQQGVIPCLRSSAATLLHGMKKSTEQHSSSSSSTRSGAGALVWRRQKAHLSWVSLCDTSMTKEAEKESGIDELVDQYRKIVAPLARSEGSGGGGDSSSKPSLLSTTIDLRSLLNPDEKDKGKLKTVNRLFKLKCANVDLQSGKPIPLLQEKGEKGTTEGSASAPLQLCIVASPGGSKDDDGCCVS
jgi:Leucine-rich repeat (LRR) protein